MTFNKNYLFEYHTKTTFQKHSKIAIYQIFLCSQRDDYEWEISLKTDISVYCIVLIFIASLLD